MIYRELGYRTTQRVFSAHVISDGIAFNNRSAVSSHGYLYLYDNAQLSNRARVPIPVLIPHRLRVLGPEHGKVLYSITKHAMRRNSDEIGATSISFRPKVFSDPASVVD